MASTAGTVPPPISWAQRNDLLYVIIDVECKDIEHNATENSFTFKGVNALDNNKKYEVTLNFLKAIDPKRVICKNIGWCIEYTIYKQQSGPFWKSLTNDKTKLHFLKANFLKWQNESEDEGEEVNNKLLNQILGATGGADHNFDDFMLDDDLNDDDSDDNIPSLSQNDEDEDDKKDEEKKDQEK